MPDRTRALETSGLRFTTLAAEDGPRPEIHRRLFELDRAASADVPRVGEYVPVSFEQFLRMDVETPGALPDGVFLAADGERYVGVTILERELARPDTLHVAFTGTLQGYRGRGIASELKRRAVLFAQERGFRYLLTNNDSLNRPIWAVNERLGFRRLVTWRMGEKVLNPSGPPL